MKRWVILSVVALAIVAAGSIAAGREEERGRRGRGRMGRARHGVADANTAAVADANRPGRRVRERWREAFEARMERLEKIRGLAAEEGATKTAAALDEFVAEEKGRFEKQQQRIRERRKERREEGARERGGRRGSGRRGGRGRRVRPEAEGET